jgi:colanic acid/amylovoran biosynthesis glycosyltransferase
VRVAFLLSRFPVRSQTFVTNQIAGLLRRGVDVEILAGRPLEPLPETGPVVELGMLDRARWVDLPESIPGQLGSALLRGLSALPRDPALVLRAFDVRRYGFAAASGRLLHMATGLSRGARYDVVHAHFGPTGILGMALRDLGIIEGRLSTVFHGFDMTEVLRLFGRSYYARLFAHGDLFLPISEHWRARLLELGAPADRTRVHRMGIDVRHFSAPDLPRSEAGRVRLLSVGRLVEKKGFEDAIAAVARLPQRLDVHYRIVGEGPLEARLRQRIASLGAAARIELVGALDHERVREAMREADVLLAPSVTARNGDQEGIPVTIMEAMAMALPVLATRHSGIPELVADAVSGFLVPEHDPPHLAERLERLVGDRDLRLAFGRAGREIVARDYDIERLNDRLVDLFTSLSQG